MIDLLEFVSAWVVIGGLVSSAAGFSVAFVARAGSAEIEPYSMEDWLVGGGFAFSVGGFLVVACAAMAPLTTTAVVLALIVASSTGFSALAVWYSLRGWRLRQKSRQAQRLRYQESLAALSGEVYRALTAARDGGEPLIGEQRAVIEEYAELHARGGKTPVGERERIESLRARLSRQATAEATLENTAEATARVESAEDQR